MASFVEKIRMNQMFPTGGGFGGGSNYGEMSPDYITDVLNRVVPFVQQSEDRERDFQREMFRMQQKAHLDNIAKQMVAPQQREEMPQIRYQPSISEYQRGTLGLREKELEQKGELGRAGLDIRQQLADNPELLQTIRGNQALEQIAARLAGQRDIQGMRGEQATELQGMRGQQGMEQIGARGTIQKELQGTRGEQALVQIGARGAQARETQAEKPITPESATQNRVRQENVVRELKTKRPDLAPFITKDINGSFIITPVGRNGPTQEQFNEINQKIFGYNEDITLKPERAPVKSTAPAKKADPLGIR